MTLQYKKSIRIFMPPNLDTSSTGLNMILLLVLLALFFFVLKSKKSDDTEEK